jgi:hypothetical protein
MRVNASTLRYVKENSLGTHDVTRNLIKAVEIINLVVKHQFDEQFLAVLGKRIYICIVKQEISSSCG